MSYGVEWGTRDLVEVSSVSELDALLERAAFESAKNSAPTIITITQSELPEDQPFPAPYGVCVGIGHAERGYALHIGLPHGGIAVEPDLAPWPGPISFDFSGKQVEYPPTDTRIRPGTALRIARHYVETGRPLPEVEWARVS